MSIRLMRKTFKKYYVDELDKPKGFSLKDILGGRKT